MRRFKISLAFLTALLCLSAAAIPSRPEPQRLVNDFAGLFTDAQTAALERELVAFDDTTSNQITILTVTDLEGYDPAEYATRIGLDWGVGSEKFDNGVVVLVKPKTSTAGQVFIAVGYGLEGAIPDAYAKRIINNEMIPHFRMNDYYGGVAAACDALMKLASGEISAARERDDDDGGLPFALILLFFILFLILISKNSKNDGDSHRGGNRGRRIHTGPIITIGDDFGRWGGTSRGGSFGGGFGGGFGGFGGGSFGGGGAGGSW